MKEQSQKDQLIQKFLRRELADEELLLFEKLMNEDEQFRKRVEEESYFSNSIDEMFENTSTLIESNLKEGPKRFSTFSRYLVPIAAGIAILLGIGLGYLLVSKSSDSKQYQILAQEYIDLGPLPEYSTFRSSDDSNSLTEDSLLKVIDFYFHTNKHQLIIDQLSNGTLNRARAMSEYDLGQYLALSLFKLERYEESIGVFNSIDSTRRHPSTSWYLGLNYLASGDLPKSTKLMGEVKENPQLGEAVNSLQQEITKEH